MIVAVPPEPVAALGDQHLFARLSKRCRIGRRRSVERKTRLRELVPGAPIVVVADPDIEVGVDPRAGKDRLQLPPGRVDRLTHRDRPQLGMVRETTVQGAQKWPAASFEMFPGVFAVEDDWDQRLFSACARRKPPSGFHETGYEIIGCGLGRPA